MRIATGIALLIGVVAGVYGDGALRQAVRDRNATAYQVMQCTKAARLVVPAGGITHEPR